MNNNIDTKQNPIKLTIPEYPTKHDISPSTVRNWIKLGKVEWELVKGKYLIHDYQVDINPTQSDTNIDTNKSDVLLSEKDNLIQFLMKEDIRSHEKTIQKK